MAYPPSETEVRAAMDWLWRNVYDKNDADHKTRYKTMRREPTVFFGPEQHVVELQPIEFPGTVNDDDDVEIRYVDNEFRTAQQVGHRRQQQVYVMVIPPRPPDAPGSDPWRAALQRYAKELHDISVDGYCGL